MSIVIIAPIYLLRIKFLIYEMLYILLNIFYFFYSLTSENRMLVKMFGLAMRHELISAKINKFNMSHSILYN